jgi:hypothetical protein
MAAEGGAGKGRWPKGRRDSGQANRPKGRHVRNIGRLFGNRIEDEVPKKKIRIGSPAS